MKITFAGSGDAFGSGGRFNTCFHVSHETGAFLIDCGASSMIALKAQNLDPNTIDAILITHFHGDHFGGIPYFMLDAQFFSKRHRPLSIFGPVGLEDWYIRVMETTFPGSSKVHPKFELTLQELSPGETVRFDDVKVTTARVRHGKPEGPFHAYRIGAEGKILSYTGDTEWTDALIDIGRNADLMIAEAYFYEKKVPLHLDLRTLEEKLPLIQPKRLILTHMNDDMLSRVGALSHECAYDGLSVDI
ncbi:MAG: MBL fold metallo-hydrolase [Pseudomonadota bacterium]